MAAVVHRLSDVDPEARSGTCSVCGPVKVKPKQHGRGAGIGWRCAIAERRWQSHAPTRRRRNPPPADGRCEVCGDVADLVWDHDHRTLRFRGWLCRSCNTGLGMFGDDPARLQAAIDYLRARS